MMYNLFNLSRIHNVIFSTVSHNTNCQHAYVPNIMRMHPWVVGGIRSTHGTNCAHRYVDKFLNIWKKNPSIFYTSNRYF